jgi:hypothetical protein
MEILTTVEVEGKTLTLEQTINFPVGGKFVTIKELFSIEGEIFVSLINHAIPYTIPSTEIQTGRFIMPAKQFLLSYNSYL